MLWFCCCPGAWGSQNITLGWDAAPGSKVAGYVLYYGTESYNFTTRIDVGTNTTSRISGLTEGLTYYFAITAYNAARIESAPSGEFAYIVPGILTMVPPSNGSSLKQLEFPVAPGGVYAVQASVDLKSWNTIWQPTTATSNAWVAFQDPQSSAFPKRFYRLVISSNAPAGPLLLSIANNASLPTLSSAQFQLSAPAASGKTCLLQYSTNLTNWSSVYTNQQGKALSFVDTPPSSQAWRYYRSLLVSGSVNATSIVQALASNSFLPNVVGFVHVSAPPGFSLIANPFVTTNNTLAGLLSHVPNGSKFAKYISGQGYVTNLFSSGQWNSGATTLNPGEGGFFGNPGQTNLPLTFVGQVLQGSLTNSLPSGNSIRAPMVPLANALASLPASNGDKIECYVNGVLITYTSFLGSWSGGSVNPPLALIPGKAYLMIRSSATNWIESFSLGH